MQLHSNGLDCICIYEWKVSNSEWMTDNYSYKKYATHG